MTLNGTTKLPCANNDLVAAPARQSSRRPTGLLAIYAKVSNQRRGAARQGRNQRQEGLTAKYAKYAENRLSPGFGLPCIRRILRFISFLKNLLRLPTI